MRTKQQIDEEIVELQIERAFVSAIEADGEKQLEEISEFDKDKSENKKLIATLKRKYFLHNLLSAIKIKLPKVCTAILCVIIISAVMLASNESAMAQIGRFIVEKYTTHFDVTTSVDDEINYIQDAGSVFTYIPENYELMEITLSHGSLNGTVVGFVGEEIYEISVRSSNNLSIGIDAENGSVLEEGFYEGYQYAYVEQEPNFRSLILYKDNAIIRCYCDYSAFDPSIAKEELLKIAAGLEV
ncbi:MAG: hypothetical protein R3Y45_05445 [Bacillota bacterium]